MATSPLLEELVRRLAHIQGYEESGLYDEAIRELGALPPALRELPIIAMRRAGLLERSARFAEALAGYECVEPCTLASLGRVRCLTRLHRLLEARRLLAAVPFDAALVKEFVETRDLLS